MNELLSSRVNNLSSSATLQMSQKANDLKCKGVEVLDLSVGEPDFETPKFIQDAAIEAINSGQYFSYPPSAGYEDFRKAIAKKLLEENNIQCESNQIVVSAGAKMSLSLTFMSIINPGDEVIIFAPYWVSYYAMASLPEGKPIILRGRRENNYKITANELEKAITSKTKAILFSSPCNPTGAVFSEHELKSIAKVVEKHKDIFIVADEIYEHIIFDKKHFSIGSLESVKDRTITINGLSKGYSMTGWRLGYLAAPKCVAAACAKLQSQFASGTCGIVQRAGMAGIEGGKKKIQYMVDAYRERRDLLLKLFKSKLPYLKLCIPEGAFYLFPDVSYYFGKAFENYTINTASDFSEYLLDRAAIATVSGESFGEPNCIRISYASSKEDLIKSIEKMEECLNVLK